MIGRITSPLLCACLIATAAADNVPNQAHTPPQSPFHAVGDETLTWPRSDVEYQGRATLNATYRFVFDDESGYQQNPYLYLEPTPDSQSQLPYLTRWVYESDSATTLTEWTETAKEIWVTNVAEAALALLGKALAEEVLAGKHQKVTGQAIMVIEGFSAGYECDNPSFSTRLVEVKHEISAPSIVERGFGSGC